MAAEQHWTKALATRQREAPRVGQVLLLYMDEALNDATLFGSVRRQAFAILPKEALWSSFANSPGSRWPARMASTIASPVIPVMSSITW